MVGPEQRDSINLPEAPAQSFVEKWANAPALITEYPGGICTEGNHPYEYLPGRYLEIDGNQVMDTSEAPWAEKTSLEAFRYLNDFPKDHRLKILERGAGLNILGTSIVFRLYSRARGDYHVIELNRDVLASTQEWKRRFESNMEDARTKYYSPLDINITIHPGEAVQVTNELVENRGERYDFIAADTFPIDPAQKGFNDIEDIETLKKGLTKNGVFTFFPYFPESHDPIEDAYLRSRQLDQIRKHFKHIEITEVPVKPASHYRYLFRPNGKPVRFLTVIICTEKK